MEPALATARRFAGKEDRRIYTYHLTRRSPGAIASNELVKHTTDIRYVFGNLLDTTSEDDEAPYHDQNDRTVSDLMQNAWASFSRDGVPVSPDGVEWPRYDIGKPMTAWVGDEVEIRPALETELMRMINGARANKSRE
jgi:para-nitrobenzyl esterase